MCVDLILHTLIHSCLLKPRTDTHVVDGYTLLGTYAGATVATLTMPRIFHPDLSFIFVEWHRSALGDDDAPAPSADGQQ